jgi:hypothetical protein
MIDCTPDESGKTCTRCGWQWKYAGTRPWPRRNCNEPEDPTFLIRRRAEIAEAEAAYIDMIDPTPLEKAGHYAKALLKWSAAGFPVRTDEDVAAIVVICRACEKWDCAKAACGVCGCGVSQSRWAVVNKARMGSEVCPLKKWS